MPSALVHSPPPGLSLRVLSALLLPAAWSEPTPMTFLDGYATYYAPGLMEKVAANRGIDLQAYLGGVALNRAGDLGRAVWLEWGPGQVEGPLPSRRLCPVQALSGTAAPILRRRSGRRHRPPAPLLRSRTRPGPGPIHRADRPGRPAKRAPVKKGGSRTPCRNDC